MLHRVFAVLPIVVTAAAMLLPGFVNQPLSPNQASAEDNSQPPTAGKRNVDNAASARPEGPFDARLLEIAKNYRSYGRVDDETRWAPWLCRMPMPSLARVSRSEDDATHGEKLYFLFARQRDAYLRVGSGQAAKPGQVIVKESWHPVELSENADGIAEQLQRRAFLPKESRKLVAHDSGKTFATRGSYVPYAKKDGKLFKADRLAGLFIMFKTDAEAASTDNGWVYGTVTADGRQVTAAGRIQSCMNCHQEAPHGRLFGLNRKTN